MLKGYHEGFTKYLNKVRPNPTSADSNNRIMIDEINSETKISKAAFEDLESILKIQKLAFLSEAQLYNTYQLEPLNQTIDSIRDEFKVCTFLKAEYKTQIIGSVRARETPDYCWIGRLIVEPEYQNKGIGRKLMTAIENEFPGSKQFLLYTGHKSTRNINLYESIGYNKKEILIDEKTPDIPLVKMIKTSKRKPDS